MRPLRLLQRWPNSNRTFGPYSFIPCLATLKGRTLTTLKSSRSLDILVGAGLSADEAQRVLDSCKQLQANGDLLVRNVTFMKAFYKPHHITKLLRHKPEVFTAHLEEWHQFLTGYGLDDKAVWKVLRYSPGLLVRVPTGDVSDGSSIDGATPPVEANTPYNVGSVIMYLKSYGWTDEEVALRLLPCYPEVLAATTGQLQATVDFLRSRNFDEESIGRMVKVFPPLLVAPYNEPLLQLIDRIRASAHNKYVISGSYHV
ncbi:hypothetical protein Vretimale_12248 [Volvox reticuliferus]|uniref:Mitochondrial transcription termination factor n=1 Tax=Volvox reticuliferus TaxID=1737510 RepID=A0A8J4CHK0_9CHLO|nr:hypothetical protein Vretifemale_8960 [Volvox reticuliferus]GIM08269.1 hypothetical protein Vretimale_12248 [Volvox reticuliferus]